MISIEKITEIKFETQKTKVKIWHPKKKDCLDAVSPEILRALIKHLQKQLKKELEK